MTLISACIASFLAGYMISEGVRRMEPGLIGEGAIYIVLISCWSTGLTR